MRFTETIAARKTNLAIRSVLEDAPRKVLEVLATGLYMQVAVIAAKATKSDENGFCAVGYAPAELGFTPEEADSYSLAMSTLSKEVQKIDRLVEDKLASLMARLLKEQSNEQQSE